MKSYLLFLVAFLCFSLVNAQSPDVIAKQFMSETENGVHLNKKNAFFKDYNSKRKNAAVEQRAEEFVAIYRSLEKIDPEVALRFALGMSNDPIPFPQILKTFTKEERIAISAYTKKVVNNYKSGNSTKSSSTTSKVKPVGNSAADILAKKFIAETENGANVDKTEAFYKEFKLSTKGKNRTMGDFCRDFVAIYRSLESINPSAALSFANCMSLESETDQYSLMGTFTEKERNYLKSKSKSIASQTFKIKPETHWTIYKFTNSNWRARVPEGTKVLGGSLKMYMPNVSVNNKTIPLTESYVHYINGTDQQTGNVFCVVKTYIENAKMPKASQISGDYFIYGISLAVLSLYPNDNFNKAVKNTNSIYKVNVNIDKSVYGFDKIIVMTDDSGNSIVANLFHHYGTSDLLIHFIKFNKKVNKLSDITDQEWEFLHQYEWSATK